MNQESFSSWVRALWPARGVGAKLARLAAVALAASCSAHFDDDTEVTGTVQESVIQSRSLTVSLLGGTAIQGFTVGAANSVDARDRVKVTGLTLATTSGLTVGNDARVGSISAKGAIRVGDRSQVSGNVKAGGTLTISPSATVTGTRQSGVNFGAVSVTTLAFTAESVSAGPISVGTDQTLDVSPGTYDALSIQSRSTVTLHTGVYLFKGAITLEPQSALAIDSRNGPVQVYFEGDLTFRGAIKPATVGVPQLLMGKLGIGNVLLERSFVGALLAPSADVALQAAQPDGHLAVIYGKTVRLEPDTIVRPYPFDWGGIDPKLTPPPPPNTPVVQMPPTFDLPVQVDATGGGHTTATAHAEPPLTFAMPPSYPVTGGYIGDGGVTFTFHVPLGSTVTCTYKGGAASSMPTTIDELNKGRTLHFQSCSDGLPPGATRLGDDFTLTADGVDGFPVSVSAPIIKDGGCTEQLSLLSPEQTTQMRTSFTWSGKAPIAESNPDGSPALYYAWLLLRTKADALNARKLFIHLLGRPLFEQELDAFAGRCGTFSNSGDGFGAFVPVLIPGRTYNRLLAALTDPNVTGDRTIFDAIVLRNNEVPAAARNANGSVRIDVLGASGFRYLHYEPRPLNSNAVTLDGGHVTRTVVGALQFVVGTAQAAAQAATDALAAIDRFVRGKALVTVHIHAADLDPSFKATPPLAMVRGWGPRRGRPLGAPGMEVIILQKFFDTLIPSTSRGLTNDEGTATIEAVANASSRGSGICIEHLNDSVRITDFLTAGQTCDLRSLSSDAPARLNLNDGGSTEFRSGSPFVVGHYQADDAHQWADKVAGFKLPRARVLTGYWASTFARPSVRVPGEKIPYAPCLDLAGGISDEALLGAQSVGILANLISPTLPPVLIGSIVDSFVSVMTHTDIVMPTDSNVARSRGVMSHEFGHFFLCGLFQAQTHAPGALQTIVMDTIAANGDMRLAARSFNEGFADFTMAQVAGGVSYDFLSTRKSFPKPGSYYYCVNHISSLPCVDDNLRGTADSATSSKSVGRYMTLLQDLFDGQMLNGLPAPLGQNLPGDGDLWENVNADGTPRDGNFTDDRLVPYQLSAPPPVFGYGTTFESQDHVALPGRALKNDLFFWLASDMFGGVGMTDQAVYNASSRAVAANGKNWCDACQVLALHSPSLPQTEPAADPATKELFAECLKPSTTVASALGLVYVAPEPSGNIDATTCMPCPAGRVSDAAGNCVACNGVVQGNQCVQCTADITIDGATVDLGVIYAFNSSAVFAGDNCPGILWVELKQPQQIFARGRTRINATVGPVPPLSQANCARPFEFQFMKASGGAFGAPEVSSATGILSCPLGACTCTGVPGRTLLSTDVTSEPVRFGTSSGDATKQITLSFPNQGT